MRLALFAVVALLPFPALATDYVKCEAIARAYERGMTTVGAQGWRNYNREHCPPASPEIQIACFNKIEPTYLNEVEPEALRRLQKIKDDYKKAGCP